MLKYDKESLEESDNQSRQVSVKELQTIILQHQDKIDRMNHDLSTMLKKYLQPVINKTDIEQDGRREWLKQNSDISLLASKIAKESKEYLAALKEHDAKPAPRFYEIWKKNTMTYEMDQLNKWRESISFMNDKLAHEKENYLTTPLAKQFIDNYVKEQISAQNNQKGLQAINLQREYLSNQRREIAQINFTASQIKNSDAKITVNGNVEKLKNVVSQGDKIKNQLSKIQLNEKTISQSRGGVRYR